MKTSFVILLGLFGLSQVMAQTPASCNRTPCFGSIKVDEKRFFLVDSERKNWYQAADHCRSIEMELASITSSEENTAIGDMLEGCSLTETVWVGGNDLANNNKWFWLATGLPISQTWWAAGEPRTGDCMLTSRVSGQPSQWKVDNCKDKVYFFVCEKKPCSGCNDA